MIKGLLFIGGLGVASYGVYKYYTSQIAILENSKIKLLSVDSVSNTKNNFTLRINLLVTNNSEQSFIIKNYNFEIYFNNKFIGNIKSSEINKTIMPNGGSTNLSFDFKLNPSQINITDILSGLISNRMASNLSLKGRVNIKKGFLTVSAPIDEDYSLKDLF